MKKLKLLESTKYKILFLLLLSFLVFATWQNGLENIYQKTLVSTTNVILKTVKRDTYIKIEKDQTNQTIFRVYTKINGKRGNYPQKSGAIHEPFIIILTWQIFLFFVIDRKKAIHSTVTNILSFFLFQVLFLIFLTGYYTSGFQKFIFDMMLDNFYIIALILVIKDNIRYHIFLKNAGS